MKKGLSTGRTRGKEMSLKEGPKTSRSVGGGGLGRSTVHRLLQRTSVFTENQKLRVLAGYLIPPSVFPPPGGHVAAAASRPGCPQRPLRLLRLLLLPGVHGAVCGVLLPSGRGHVHGSHLRVGVTTSGWCTRRRSRLSYQRKITTKEKKMTSIFDLS